jgi:glucosamine--fructose-6-phosphate aminotransferase (isomerizing)
MAGAGALVIGLVSEAQRANEMAVLAEVRAQGARTLALANRDAEVILGAGLSDLARNVLYLPFGQLVAFERALSKKLNPDKPENLEAFVVLK